MMTRPVSKSGFWLSRKQAVAHGEVIRDSRAIVLLKNKQLVKGDAHRASFLKPLFWATIAEMYLFYERLQWQRKKSLTGT